MIKLLIFIGIGYFLYRQVKGPKKTKRVFRQNPSGEISDTMVRDPMCGTYVAKQHGTPLQHDGRTLYFCGTECRSAFLKKEKP